MGLLNSLSGQQEHVDKGANCKTTIPDEKDLSKVLENPPDFPISIIKEMQNGDIINCSSSGVTMHFIPNMLKLEYSGVLAQNNAQEIFAVIGYGNNDNWQDISYLPMHKTSQSSFELLTFRKRAGNVNLAFKDNAGNWDNNSGKNYVFYSTSGQGSH